MAKIKVIMTWNIKEGKQQEYIEFAVGELGPSLNGLGMQISEVWYTIAGDNPEMVVLGVMANKTQAQRLFNGDEWRALETTLEQYVENIKVKFRAPHAPFQM
ncbi:MAG: hypothetical protein NVS2B7_24960 [Herpetosiphon sp.]